jgi:hypothetical protein
MKTYSEIAHAIPNPSAVDVPRPSSSIMIKESEVAVFFEDIRTNHVIPGVLTLRIVAVSSISAIKVDTPFN